MIKSKLPGFVAKHGVQIKRRFFKVHVYWKGERVGELNRWNHRYWVRVSCGKEFIRDFCEVFAYRYI